MRWLRPASFDRPSGPSGRGSPGAVMTIGTTKMSPSVPRPAGSPGRSACGEFDALTRSGSIDGHRRRGPKWRTRSRGRMTGAVTDLRRVPQAVTATPDEKFVAPMASSMTRLATMIVGRGKLPEVSPELTRSAGSTPTEVRPGGAGAWTSAGEDSRRRWPRQVHGGVVRRSVVRRDRGPDPPARDRAASSRAKKATFRRPTTLIDASAWGM